MVADALSRMYIVLCCVVSEVHPSLKMFQILEQDYEKDEENQKISEGSETHPEYKIV